MRPARAADQRGAASLLVVSMLGLVLLVGGALGVAGAMVAAHRRAQSAADGAVLTACVLDGADVLVTVSVPGPRWLGQTHDLTAAARAGPQSQVSAGEVVSPGSTSGAPSGSA